jgi:hypothetical protein
MDLLDLGDIVHAHEEDLELYLRGRLEPGHASTLEFHLSGCQACRDHLSECVGSRLAVRLSTGTSSAGQYKRSELRFAVGEDAVCLELHPLCVERQTITLVDVSRNGLGMVSPKAILPGTIVQIRIKAGVETGEVRYCLASGGQTYRIGVRLDGKF